MTTPDVSCHFKDPDVIEREYLLDDVTHPTFVVRRRCRQVGDVTGGVGGGRPLHHVVEGWKTPNVRRVLESVVCTDSVSSFS